MKHRRESGQATIELAAILVGLVAIMLGMIFVAGLCMGNNRTFLDSKQSTETVSRSQINVDLSDQKEFSYWVYTTLSNALNTSSSKVDNSDGKQQYALNGNYDIFRYYDENKVNAGSEKLTIPFLADDVNYRTDDDSIGKIPAMMNDSSTSATSQYSYRWYDTFYFDSDLRSELFMDNSFIAANLVTSENYGTTTTLYKMTNGYQDNASAKMYDAFYKWFGVKVSQDQLRKIPSNQTYMPSL